MQFSTEGVLSYFVSDNLKQDIVTKAVERLIDDQGDKLADDVIIQSDQDIHYASPAIKKLVRGVGIVQSMSRRGNSWDKCHSGKFI